MTEDELFEDVRYWKGRADAAESERDECKATLEALMTVLKVFLGHDQRFQIAIGGNPLAIEKMLSSARRSLTDAGGEVA